jgi:hypothetical protein
VTERGEVVREERIHPRKTVEVKGASHVVMISRPKPTTDLIVTAARSVR